MMDHKISTGLISVEAGANSINLAPLNSFSAHSGQEIIIIMKNMKELCDHGLCTI